MSWHVMNANWENAHTTVHDLLCSHDPFQTILLQLKNLLLQYIFNDTPTTKVCEKFAEPLIPYKELRPATQQFLVQVIYLLGVQSVIDILYELLIQSAVISTKPHICWPHLLALISTIAVTVRGGIPVVKAFIRKLLSSIFHPDRTEEVPGLTEDALSQVPDELTQVPYDETTQPQCFSEPDRDCFCGALLLARQLSVEDVRLTGFTYAQWWTETFCSVSPVGTDSGAHILTSRADFSQLADFLIDLLPWESDPRLLHIQLSQKPVWLLSTSGQKQGVKTVSMEPNRLDEDDPLVLDADLALTELESLDTHLLQCCSQRWNDYVEIGRGRLAELRERHPDMNVIALPQTLDSSHTDIINPEPTSGWSEVCAWLDEVEKQLDGNPGLTMCRIPHSFTEAHLFQPRRLRSVLIPALLHAPELNFLSESKRAAREQFLAAIRRAGLATLLEPFVDTATRSATRTQKRMRPPRASPIANRTRRGTSTKRMTVTTAGAGRAKRRKPFC